MYSAMTDVSIRPMREAPAGTTTEDNRTAVPVSSSVMKHDARVVSKAYAALSFAVAAVSSRGATLWFEILNGTSAGSTASRPCVWMIAMREYTTAFAANVAVRSPVAKVNGAAYA